LLLEVVLAGFLSTLLVVEVVALEDYLLVQGIQSHQAHHIRLL
jgi:hypothetical protein